MWDVRVVVPHPSVHEQKEVVDVREDEQRENGAEEHRHPRSVVFTKHLQTQETTWETKEKLQCTDTFPHSEGGMLLKPLGCLWSLDAEHEVSVDSVPTCTDPLTPAHLWTITISTTHHYCPFNCPSFIIQPFQDHTNHRVHKRLWLILRSRFDFPKRGTL